MRIARIHGRGPRTGGLQLGALMIGVALLVVGNGLQGTLVGVRAGLEGMSEGTIGVVMSAYFAGFVAGSVYTPRLIERVGHIRAFAALASVASALALVFAMLIVAPVWVVLRAIHGACYAGLVIVIESWLNGSTERSQRGTVLGTYMVVLYGSWALSQPMLNLAPADGFVLFCLVSMCLSLSLVPITLTDAGVPGGVTPSRLGVGKLYAISPLAVIGAFTMGAVIAAFFGMGPTYAQASGLDKAGIATFLSVMLLGALTVQWPAGWLSDRVERRYVIVVSACVGAAAAVAISLYNGAGVAPLLVLSYVFGGASMPIYSLCVAHANDRVDEHAIVATASGLVLVYGIGSIFGPVVASLAMEAVGERGLFGFIAASLGAYAVYAGFRTVRGPRELGRAKPSFVAVPQTSHAVIALYRRVVRRPHWGRRAPPK